MQYTFLSSQIARQQLCWQCQNSIIHTFPWQRLTLIRAARAVSGGGGSADDAGKAVTASSHQRL